MTDLEKLHLLLDALPKCCECSAPATVECGPEGETWSLCDQHRDPLRPGSPHLTGSDHPWADALRQIGKDVPAVASIPLANVVVCIRCGSVIDYPRLGRGAEHTCRWCPACSPREPWRKGTVVDESHVAKKIRESEAPS